MAVERRMGEEKDKSKDIDYIHAGGGGLPVCTVLNYTRRIEGKYTTCLLYGSDQLSERPRLTMEALSSECIPR